MGKRHDVVNRYVYKTKTIIHNNINTLYLYTFVYIFYKLFITKLFLQRLYSLKCWPSTNISIQDSPSEYLNGFKSVFNSLCESISYKKNEHLKPVLIHFFGISYYYDQFENISKVLRLTRLILGFSHPMENISFIFRVWSSSPIYRN